MKHLIFLAIGMLTAAMVAGQEAQPGLTIISPRASFDSHLIDLQGDVVKVWHGADAPGEFAYMLPDSSVLRPCRVPDAGGRGGRIQHIDADDNVTWDFTFATETYLQHHDIEPMPGGNVLLVAWELYSIAEAEAAGRVDISNDMKVTYLVEIEPVGATGGQVVWEWRAWDHLIQDVDPAKPNYGVVADHPGRIDINFGEVPGGTWLHTNAISYNVELDQIVISARNTSEIYVIDHGTTSEEAAGPAGDILYRWGNPLVYGRGGEEDQMIWGPHGAIWIEPGLPGAGNILIFNNGDKPGTADDLSSVEEILPPQSEPGVYILEPGQAFGPDTASWRYGDVPGFFSATLGGAYRMPNGNTLICEGRDSHLFEVTPSGQTVWTHFTDGTVHRTPRYWVGVSPAPPAPDQARLTGNHPNPFNPSTRVTFTLAQDQEISLAIHDAAGHRVRTLAGGLFTQGHHSVTWDGKDDAGRALPSGIYMVQMDSSSRSQTRKITLVR